MSEKKKQIFYTREYRHMKGTPLSNVVEICLTLIPFLVLMWKYYSSFSFVLSEFVINMLKVFFKVEPIMAQNDSLSFLGPVFYADHPGRQPNFTMSLLLLIAVLFGMIIILQILDKYKPFMIYIAMFLAILLVSDVYFIFWGGHFPYTLGSYSNIYMIQQAVMWMAIAMVTIISISVLPGIHGSTVFSFWGIMLYAVVYGSVRYIVFVVFLYLATNVFMAPIYFMCGVFLDFMYVVAIYAICARKISEKFSRKKEMGVWKWS